jgi:hypothetical protein
LGWPAAALAGRLGSALADGLGVAGRHPKPVAGEGFAQRRPGGAQLSGDCVHRAESFGELEGAFGLGPVGQEAAGLPAQRLPRMLRNRRQQLDEADVAALVTQALSVLRPAG